MLDRKSYERWAEQHMTQVIGNRYEIIEEIGAGGMGTVYRGLDRQTRQPIAVKQLKTDVSSPDMIERFKREGEALRALNHPNIIKMLDAVEQEGQQYLIMEYVPGGDLHTLLKTETLSIQRILQIMLDLADALTRAHRLNIVHRDLKPANVLIAEDSAPRLTDFGVARMGHKERVTATGAAVGTVDYLSPETLLGDEADPRADIWAFGVMLFEMLTGQRPFDRETATGTLIAIVSDPVPDLEALRADLPVALVDLVYRMLEKNREARIPSIRVVGAELEALLQGRSAESKGSQAVAQPPVDTTRFGTPTPSASQRKHNLPAQTTPFVGREAELAELAKLINDPASRLVTILAPGGMGKTRLSLEAAAQVADFADGVFFVPLAPLNSPDLILPAIAEATQFDSPVPGDLKQQLLAYFQQKSMLLVFDNFEHLLAGASLLTDILQAAPQIKIIATSRTKLNLQEETVFRIEGMDFPDWETPEDALEYSAVKLFMQSARRVQPSFEIKPDDLTLLARICRQVQGMPLGILLAAAWVDALTLREISQEIAQNLDFLETEQQNFPSRQRSIRAVFDYSWNLLTTEERAAFANVSVFRGGFSRDAAQSIAGISLRMLTTLVNKSLLRRYPDSGRYEVHELLRQYAETQLEQTDSLEATSTAHSRFYIDLMRRQEADLKSSRQSAAAREIDVDLENFRNAWVWAVRQRDYDAIGSAFDSLNLHGQVNMLRRDRHELVDLACDQLAPRPGEEAHHVWGQLLLPLFMFEYTNPKPDIKTRLETSLALAELHQIPQELFNSVLATGRQLTFDNEYAAALACFERCLTLSEQLADKTRMSNALFNIAVVHSLAGDRPKAVQVYLQSLDFARQTGASLWLVTVLSNLYGEADMAGDSAGMRQYAEEYSAMNSLLTNRVVFGNFLMLSYQMRFSRDLAAIKAISQVVTQDVQRLNSEFSLRAYHGLTGFIAMRDEDYSSAKAQLHDGLLFGAQMKAGTIRFISNYGLGYVGWGENNMADLKRHCHEALKIADFYRSEAYQIFCMPLLAKLMLEEGNKERVVEVLSMTVHHRFYPPDMLEVYPLASRLRASLESELGAEVYLEAWERGKTLTADSIINELFPEFSESKLSSTNNSPD